MSNEEILLRLQPKQAIREELGGDYYWRCPWLACNKIIRSEWFYCPACGQAVFFEKDSYTEEKGAR